MTAKTIDPSTPEGLKAARKALGLSDAQMARLLGHEGENARSAYHRKEQSRAPISPLYARMVQAYLDGYRPADWPYSDSAEIDTTPE